ncbi:MAG: hypothetical protein Q8M83_00605 [bacterium]|nr:hypothetical protein [bacterium]
MEEFKKENLAIASGSDDEILVKGEDNQWYILKGEELLPYHQASPISSNQSHWEQEVERFINNSRLSFSDSSQKARFREIILARFKEVRDNLETKEALKKAVAQGGLGLSEEIAEGVKGRLIKFFKDSPSEVEQEKTEVENEIVKKESAPPAGPIKPILPIAADKSPLVNELDRLVGDTVRENGVNFSDQILTNRFRFLVSARLRDIKDVLETRETLLRDQKIGGLGLKEQEAERIISVVEKNFKEFHKKWREAEERKIEEWKKKQTEDAADKKSRTQAKAAAEMEEMRFKLLARAGIKEKQEKIVAPKPELPKPPIMAVASSQKPSKPSLPSRKPSLPPLPTAPSTPSPTSFRPKMIDVKFTPRLLSPLEELREMKLADFRRLARDPEEIILKIKAKIDLLEHESFAKKMQGIEAWRQSEPARLYRELSGQALNSGKTIDQAIFERENKKEPTLTVQEFYAIMELNKSLRF